MGFFFRRSASFGPFRLNFSKSGVGASVGVRGARVTMTSRGTTYVTVGRKGFYYRETISNRRPNKEQTRSPSDGRPVAGVSCGEIPTAESNLVDSSSEQLLQRLNERARMFNPAWLVYLGAVLLFLIGTSMVGSGGVFILGIIIHKRNRDKRTTRLVYDLDERENRKYGVIEQAVAHLSNSHQIWRIEADAPTSDWKRNAGASSLVRRVKSTVGHSTPPRMESNLEIPSIRAGRAMMYFMPDLILYWEKGSFGAISYDDLRVEIGSTRFIEDGYVPRDTKVVSTTWRYVNKNGGPDRRFNNNVQVSIVLYGTLALRSSHGLNIHLQTSSVHASIAFANCWREAPHRMRGDRPQEPPPQTDREIPPTPHTQARNVLGVSGTASSEEIAAAYRQLAQMYHPDKVSGLAPEFQQLADRRMKEINAAYELLKRRSNPA
jgi:hypothetical protein